MLLIGKLAGFRVWGFAGKLPTESQYNNALQESGGQL